MNSVFYLSCRSRTPLLSLLLIIFAGSVQAQENRLPLTLSEAESLFIERNLTLMAERLNIDIRDAEVRQARLWENPEITVEHQIINREQDGIVGFTGRDNTVFEVEQLITTAGKRGRQIQLLELEKRGASYAFDQLLRSFKRELREHYFLLGYLNRTVELYSEQVEGLERMLSAFEKEELEGVVSRMDILRLRNLLLQLTQEYRDVLNEQSEAEGSLKVLLQMEDQTPVPHLPDRIEQGVTESVEMAGDQLLKIAYDSRNDLQALDTRSSISRQLLRVERSNAFPDVSVGLLYDRLDGVVENYFGLTLNVQIPLWNRNQGNIESARHQIRQSDYHYRQLEQQIVIDINQAILQYERAWEMLERLDVTYHEDFSAMIEALMEEYRRGDIRLVEFIDYYESFREGVIRTFEIQRSYLNAVEAVNFTAGRDVIEFNF